LAVFKSGKHIYAQVIDDRSQRTLVAASSLDKRLKLKHGGNREAAAQVGELLAKASTDAGITQVVFDRGGHPYHGRIEQLASAAREGGLEF
jgi:large subunit ribosomal protein L18